MQSARLPVGWRVVVGMLLLAVWLASTLGLVHATLHVPGQPPLEATSLDDGGAADAVVGVAHPHRHGWLHALFGDRTDAECRLYDQLSHGAAALGVPPLILPFMLPAAKFAWLDGEALARWVALFDARGPPVTR